MVLYDASNDFNQASAFCQRSAASAAQPEYPPVWLMMMKLRNIMGKRESIYKLSGTVELDEAFFPTRMEADEKAEPMKRGAGSQRQSKVLVIVESKAVDDILRAYLESIV